MTTVIEAIYFFSFAWIFIQLTGVNIPNTTYFGKVNILCEWEIPEDFNSTKREVAKRRQRVPVLMPTLAKWWR